MFSVMTSATPASIGTVLQDPLSAMQSSANRHQSTCEQSCANPDMRLSNFLTPEIQMNIEIKSLKTLSLHELTMWMQQCGNWNFTCDNLSAREHLDSERSPSLGFRHFDKRKTDMQSKWETNSKTRTSPTAWCTTFGSSFRLWGPGVSVAFAIHIGSPSEASPTNGWVKSWHLFKNMMKVSDWPTTHENFEITRFS